MKFGVMITNGPGGHPPWKHADVTAEKLILDPAEGADDYGAKLGAAAELRHRVRTLLEVQHRQSRDYELEKIKKVGSARLTEAFNPNHDYITDMIGKIVALAVGTPLAAFYAKPEVQAAMRAVLVQEFATQQFIHRSEHADKNPNDPRAKAFRAKQFAGA